MGPVANGNGFEGIVSLPSRRDGTILRPSSLLLVSPPCRAALPAFHRRPTALLLLLLPQSCLCYQRLPAAPSPSNRPPPLYRIALLSSHPLQRAAPISQLAPVPSKQASAISHRVKGLQTAFWPRILLEFPRLSLAAPVQTTTHHARDHHQALLTTPATTLPHIKGPCHLSLPPLRPTSATPTLSPPHFFQHRHDGYRDSDRDEFRPQRLPAAAVPVQGRRAVQPLLPYALRYCDTHERLSHANTTPHAHAPTPPPEVPYVRPGRSEADGKATALLASQGQRHVLADREPVGRA